MNDFPNQISDGDGRCNMFACTMLKVFIQFKQQERVGYTRTNDESLKYKILQRCGFINSQNLNTNEWYWHVTTPH
jgi:hypothetical protein